jgi:Xaa-Pro aminopeptidase
LNDVFAQRREKLRDLINESGVHGLYVTKEANVRYLTGKKGNDCSLWITGSEAYILTDFRYREMAMELAPSIQYAEIKIGQEAVHFFDKLGEIVIGVEKDSLPLSEYITFKERLTRQEIRLTEGLVESLRAVKDSLEIEATQKACAIADACFTHMCAFLKPGLTEKQAALEIEYFMKSRGADDLSFDTICISGAKTSHPHGVPDNKIIEKGDFLTMDYGCKVDGYCSDMTRTVAIGSATPQMREIYDIVLNAQMTACQGIKAGMLCKDADGLARDIIRDAGYGEYFGHGLGHGTGLEIHEAPRLRPGCEEVLKENNIVSIEPGIYLPKKFGVRIEDLATVTSFGIINNVKSPKELLII